MGGPSLRLPHVVLQPAVVVWGKRGISWEGPLLKCPMLCYSLALINPMLCCSLALIKISHVVLQPGPHLKCPILCCSLLLWEKEVQNWEALI